MKKFLMVGILGLIGSRANAQCQNGQCPRPVGKVEQASYQVVSKTADVVYATKETVKKSKLVELIQNRPKLFSRRCK